MTDRVIEDTIKCVTKVSERINADRRPTMEELRILRDHLDRLSVALEPLSELYQDMMVREAGLIGELDTMFFDEKRERAMQNKYRTKYRVLLRKFLKTKTELTAEQAEVFLQTLDPDAVIASRSGD